MIKKKLHIIVATAEERCLKANFDIWNSPFNFDKSRMKIVLRLFFSFVLLNVLISGNLVILRNEFNTPEKV